VGRRKNRDSLADALTHLGRLGPLLGTGSEVEKLIRKHAWVARFAQPSASYIERDPGIPCAEPLG